MSANNFQKIKQAVIDELESRRQEIERGDMNWFSIKAILRYSANRSDIRTTFQAEQERVATRDPFSSER